MSGWGGGYVTDITYSVGWYRQQSPALMAIAAVIGGSSAAIPAGDDPVRLLELGCGFGYGAMALAASNPSWSVTAVDFNPAHIAAARDWAPAGRTTRSFAPCRRWTSSRCTGSGAGSRRPPKPASFACWARKSAPGAWCI
jgi:SAM-dependent methyltransferase